MGEKKYGAMAYGMGHGAAEAVITGGLPLLSNLIFALTLQSVGQNGLVAAAGGEQSAETTELIIEFLTAYPPNHFLAAGLERIPSIAFHIACSVLLWMIASGRQPFRTFLLVPALRILYHLPGGLFQLNTLVNIWIAEILLAVFCGGICWIVLRMYQATPFLTSSGNPKGNVSI